MSAPTADRKAWSVLIVSTLAFTVCFMVWMMFGVIGIPIKKQLGLNATQFGLLTAMPVLTGSLVRVPLGIWTDRYGGRIVMTLLMASTVPAIWLMAYATAYWHFLVIGLFVGLAGGCVQRWARPTWRAGSRKTARAWRWACTAPATRVLPSISLWPRRCWWPLAGRWCRRSMPQ
jgi:MFS family permease